MPERKQRRIEGGNWGSEPGRSWFGWLLLALTLEKVIQHAVVTWGFISDIGDLRDQAAVDYRWLAVTGAIVGLLFLVAVVGLTRRRQGSLALLSTLAVVDIVGEFVAQGTLIIKTTLSFVVAVIILVLSRYAASRMER